MTSTADAARIVSAQLAAAGLRVSAEELAALVAGAATRTAAIERLYAVPDVDHEVMDLVPVAP
jgi:hypothetical protein